MTDAAPPYADARRRLTGATVAHDLGMLLALASADSVSRMTTVLAEFGLSPRSFTVLSISADGLDPTQRELATYLQVDPSQLVGIIDDLEHRGFVERRVSAADRRAKVIVATASGRDTARRSLERVREVNRTALSTADEESLRAMLDRVVYPAT